LIYESSEAKNSKLSRQRKSPVKSKRRWAQLDGYKRPLVGSLSANLQRLAMERVPKPESLQEIIAEMAESDATST
jgi:hypothetical protein